MSSEGSGSKRLLPWLLAAVVVLGAALYLAAGRGGASAPVAPSDPSAPPAPRAPRGPRQQAGAAAPAHKLSVGVLPNGESDLVYVAAALGYFEAEGLDVELARMPRGRRALGALVRGGVDVAIAGDISLATEDFDRTANVVIATVGHADEHLLVLGRKDRGVAAVSDLKGKRVGIEARMNPRYL